MGPHPDSQVLREMLNVGGKDSALCKYLELRMREMEQVCSEADDMVVVRRLQGRAQELRELVQFFENARDILVKLERQREASHTAM